MPKLEITTEKLTNIIDDLIDESNTAAFGVCWSCGNVMDYCEPDAEDYTCDACGMENVQGILACCLMIS